MGAGTKRPSGAVERARWAGVDMLGSTVRAENRLRHHEMQVARLVRWYGVSRHRAELLVPFIYGEGR